MWFGLGRAPATEGGKRLRAEGESCPQTRRSLARCRQPAGNSTATAEITATIKMPAVRPRATAWSAVSPCLSSPRLLGGGASLAGNGLPSRFASSIPERVVCQQRLCAPATSTPPFSENTFFAPQSPIQHSAARCDGGLSGGACRVNECGAWGTRTARVMPLACRSPAARLSRRHVPAFGAIPGRQAQPPRGVGRAPGERAQSGRRTCARAPAAEAPLACGAVICARLLLTRRALRCLIGECTAFVPACSRRRRRWNSSALSATLVSRAARCPCPYLAPPSVDAHCAGLACVRCCAFRSNHTVQADESLG